MNTPTTLPAVANNTSSMLTKLRLHPLIAAAAISVILLCLTGVAAMTGLLKTSKAQEGAASAVLAANTPGTEADKAGKSAPSITPPRQSRSAAMPAPVAQAPAPLVPRNLGVVENVQAVKTQGEGTGMGAVAGGVLGGVLGHQVGGGNGKKVATVAGAVGGGLLGNHVEKNMRGTTYYNVTVRMDNGERKTVRASSANAWQVGERVRVDNGKLSSAG
jgi:outer membrane lipoprotein SlyB